MPTSDYDETWATARLPSVDVNILHRRPWQGGAEQLLVTVQAVPPAEALSRWLELSNPLVVWTRAMQAAWAPWTDVLAGASKSPSALGWPRPDNRP